MARAVVLELSEGKELIGSSKNIFYGFKEPTVNRTLVKLTEKAGIEKHITFLLLVIPHFISPHKSARYKTQNLDR